MLKRFTIFVIGCCYLIIIGCSNGDSPTPTPPNPPGGNNTFTISYLVYTPSVIPIKRYIPSFNITGTITFVNASEGISKLRLTTSLGLDTTLMVSGGSGQTSGTVFTSGNAYQWEDHSLQQDYNMALNSVASSDALFVAVGPGILLSSTNGIDWAI